jgi:hypothetical protein
MFFVVIPIVSTANPNFFINPRRLAEGAATIELIATPTNKLSES